MHTNSGRSVGVIIVIQIMWLTGFIGSTFKFNEPVSCEFKDTLTQLLRYSDLNL